MSARSYWREALDFSDHTLFIKGAVRRRKAIFIVDAPGNCGTVSCRVALDLLAAYHQRDTTGLLRPHDHTECKLNMASVSFLSICATQLVYT